MKNKKNIIVFLLFIIMTLTTLILPNHSQAKEPIFDPIELPNECYICGE